MKKIFSLCIWSSAVAPLFALTKVTGKVDAVTVFTDRAVVKRVQSVDSAETTGTFRFVALPQSLVEDSVRASGTGITVTGVALRRVEKIYGDEWAEHPLKKKMVKLEAEIREQSDALANAKEQLRVLDSMLKLTTGQSDREARANAIDVESWGKALRFLEEQRSAYQRKIRVSDEKLEQLRKELERITLAFNAEIQSAKTSGTEVEVSYVKSGQAGGLVELEYMVTNVSWTSVYDLRGSAEGNEFQLVSHAIIRQNSGENWTNAKVTLSTARPSTALTPGILQPWRVTADSLFNPRPTKTAVSKLSAGSAARDEAPEEDDARGEIVDTLETTTVSITLPGRENIRSDNSDHKVTLYSAQLKGTHAHVAVPSLSSYVYLKARFKNTSAAPIIGTIHAFLDGSFVGAIALKTPAAVGEEFDAFLGVDQRMQLKRTLKRGDVAKSGLFGGKVEVVNQWEIEVSNFSKKNRQVTVYDQFPVAADPNISTQYIAASRPETQKDGNGILAWKLDLKAGEKVRFDFSYSLTFPKEIWEKFTHSEGTASTKVEQNVYEQMSPAAAPAPRQYNLEKMLRKR